MTESWIDRHFTPLLVAIAAAGLFPCIAIGVHQYIGPDAWWHLFIATQDRWSSLLSEWRYVAHPPLFYPLLRLAAFFGHSLLMLRSISILSGFAAAIVIGRVAARLCQYKASALLATASWSFSWSMIEISCEVRAYALALVFVLLAFNAYIDWTADPAGRLSRRALLRFTICSALALLSEFYVIFFLAGCLGILILRFLLRPAFRAGVLASLRMHRGVWLVATVGLTALFLGLWMVQINVQPASQPYLRTHYWDENTSLSLDAYLLSNFEQEMGYFTPLHLDPDLMLAIATLVILPALIYLLAVRKSRWRAAASVNSPLLLALLLVQMVVLSLAARYPFGGEWRHQSIVAPFVFLTGILLLDRIAGALRPVFVRSVLFTAAACLIAGNFVYGWTIYPRQTVEPYADGYAAFQSSFASSAVDAVYGDQCSTVLYWAAHHNAAWTLLDRFLVDQQRIVSYRMDDGGGHPIRVLRNKRAFYFNLADPGVYPVLAGVMRHENLKSMLLFYEGPKWDAASVPLLDQRIHQLAAGAGLACGKYSLGTSYAFVEFRLL